MRSAPRRCVLRALPALASSWSSIASTRARTLSASPERRSFTSRREVTVDVMGAPDRREVDDGDEQRQDRDDAQRGAPRENDSDQ